MKSSSSDMVAVTLACGGEALFEVSRCRGDRKSSSGASGKAQSQGARLVK